MCPLNNPPRDIPCLLFLHQESIGQKLLITSFFKSQPSTCFIIDSPTKSRSFSSYLPYIAFVKDSFFSLICFYCKLLFLSMSLLTDLYTTTWGTHLLPLLVFFWNCFLMWPSCRGYFFLSQRASWCIVGISVVSATCFSVKVFIC